MGIETLNEDLELNIPMFDDDMDIIAKLDDEPNAVGGLTAAELKAEFDRPGKTIQEYLNKTLIPSLIGTVAEESVRAQNEYIRVTNENQRVANENGRVEEEERRNTAELERIENEDSRGDNETKRVQAETARAAAEAQRESAEQAREDKTSGIVAQATEQANEAKNQADRAEEQAKKAGDEADRAAEQANLAGQVKSMQAEATTLSAGSEATAKVEEENGDLVLRVGIPDGRPGKDGRDGDPGKSAYEYAKDGGFAGTEEEFAELLANGNGGGADWDQNDPEGVGYVKGRTHYKETFEAVEVISYQVAEFNGAATAYVTGIAAGMVEGEPYTVEWNGAGYKCTAKNIGGDIFVGNFSLVRSDAEDTGEPFCIYKLSGTNYMVHRAEGDPDWNDVKVGRPYTEIYHKLSENYLPEGLVYAQHEDEVILPQTSFAAAGGAAGISGTEPLKLVPGYVYDVKWNGKAYQVLAEEHNTPGQVSLKSFWYERANAFEATGPFNLWSFQKVNSSGYVAGMLVNDGTTNGTIAITGYTKLGVASQYSIPVLPTTYTVRFRTANGSISTFHDNKTERDLFDAARDAGKTVIANNGKNLLYLVKYDYPNATFACHDMGEDGELVNEVLIWNTSSGEVTLTTLESSGGASKASELDNDVPFVSASDSQTLTEEQKQQAQENIGLGGLVVSAGGDTLTWDGNTEGLASGTMVNPVYKVSDVVLTKEQLVSGTTITVSLLDGSEERTYLLENNADIMVAENDGALIIAQSDFSVVFLASMSDETAAAGGLPGMGGTIFGLFQNSGTYMKSITIPGYTGFAKKQIKEEYIPESVPQVQTAAVGQTIVVSEVDSEGKPTRWEAASFPASNANVELDTTLSVAGKAADAKAVGDALQKINNTTTEEVTQVVSVGSESVTIDSNAPNQTVNLAWAVSGSKNIPAFTNYYIEKSGVSYPRTFNAAAYTQVWNVSAGHGNADTFVSGHQYFQALHYVMDGDGSAIIMPGGNPQYITPTNSMTVTGSGWIYLLFTPSGPTSTAYGFANTGTGTGTIDYLYCIDVTALKEAGTITATTINELAELFGGLELVPGQNYAGNVTSGEATLNITRDGETSTVDGGTATTTVQGGDILSVEGGSVTFVLKVLKEVYDAIISVWADKKWVAFGDSLTDETINADKKYYRHIEKKTGINVVVMGVGSTGYAKNYGDGTSYGERMMSCPSDADVVTIFGSINDWSTLDTGGMQIGSPSDSLDAGTYSGYVNNCIDVAISKAPYAQIALVSPMFYRGIKPEIQESISSALKAVAEYRRIKFLDLYHSSGFRIENDTFAQAYTTDYSATDETFGHPNNLAHERLIAPEFMELLRRMLLS